MNAASEKILQDYMEQVLRWNRQISLVSRRDTKGVLAGLMRQCREAWTGLRDARDFQPGRPLWYFDLGSGGGLPGFVWHVLACEAGLDVATWLVEPREKRAWFLKRLNGLLEGSPTTVLESRWGETGDFGPRAAERTPANVLISLKALHLTDSQVLKGLIPALATTRDDSQPLHVVIARFYPPEQAWTAVLADDLEIPAAGDARTQRGHTFESKGGTILPPESPAGASLVISEYSLPAD